MRIGLNITGTTAPDRVADDVATAARAGLDSVWTSQHPGAWDALTLLAASGRAAAGSGPELGTAVVPTYPRHPAVLAAEAATVQAATGSPLALGLGPSHAALVTDQLGLDYLAPAAHSREYLEIVGALLRGEHVRHRGRFFTVDTALAVAPTPMPSLLLSALGPRMLDVARDVADGTIALWVRPSLVADYLVPSLERRGPGDRARVVVGVLAAVTDDPDGVRERAARDVAAVEQMPAYRAVMERGGLDGPADALVVGTEEQVAREFSAFADAGVTDLMISPLGPGRERLLSVVREVRAGSPA